MHLNKIDINEVATKHLSGKFEYSYTSDNPHITNAFNLKTLGLYLRTP